MIVSSVYIKRGNNEIFILQMSIYKKMFGA
jgi:hypothetical protein